ncbi:hypothetical protein N658DRAFT_495975 [Parathielavia hyrcaniae]|uniref:RRM domain-containing protein n=1 Tax=Parathielavia hyrcaniae TaxID=113614 RepID=A0AAN6Q4E1_9PEZI|nr:hypothetical protein N658DRAFT_495975 [Parathielavia hyrcaniae]
MQATRGLETPPGDAFAEDRRIYIGNLLYSVKPADVEDLLRQSGFEQSVEKLHISVDPSAAGIQGIVSPSSPRATKPSAPWTPFPAPDSSTSPSSSVRTTPSRLRHRPSHDRAASVTTPQSSRDGVTKRGKTRNPLRTRDRLPPSAIWKRGATAAWTRPPCTSGDSVR